MEVTNKKAKIRKNLNSMADLPAMDMMTWAYFKFNKTWVYGIFQVQQYNYLALSNLGPLKNGTHWYK
jgi:hypothetical protein